MRSIWLESFLLLAGCPYRPSPTLVERNYQSGERMKQVRVGGDYYWMWTTPEPEAQARERLLADVRAECPQHAVLAEGRSLQPRLVSEDQLNIHTNQLQKVTVSVTDVYLWIRYRCQ